MKPEEYSSEVEYVKDRYHTLKLTIEQAEKVYQFESDKDTPSDKHYFSVWEEWDYQLTAFREILNDEQFRKYEELIEENAKDYERSLIKEDSEKASDISYHQELLEFYENQFLPDLLNSPLIDFSWWNDKSKIEYLKGEYRRFLNDSKKEILTTHFRNCRTFKPNELKLSLLRHKLSCVLPDYEHFKHHMDQPTRAVADYIKTKTEYLPRELEHLLIKKYEALKEFNDKKVKQYFADLPNAWHVVIASTDAERNEYRSMGLVLLDKEKYGF
jgi:hypothetical protein